MINEVTVGLSWMIGYMVGYIDEVHFLICLLELVSFFFFVLSQAIFIPFAVFVPSSGFQHITMCIYPLPLIYIPFCIYIKWVPSLLTAV